MLKVKNVGVVGTGLIGASWAAYYASKDFKVKMFDKISAAQESGLQRAMSHLDGLAQYGLIEKSRAKKMKGNIIGLAFRFIPELWAVIRGGVPKLVLMAEFTAEKNIK